jgi:hypothetical protein
MRSVAALALYFAGLTILVSDKVVSQTLPQPTFVDYMPQVANLDKAEYFYHQLLGLESPQGDPRARLAWYPTRPFLVDMYVVSGKIRNFYLRVPVSDLMIEPIQWSEAKGKPLNPRIQDTGSTRLILNVNNIDALTDRLKRGKAKVITTGGKPVTVTDKTGTRRTIVFEDFNGFFVQLVELDPQPPQTGDAPPTYFINGSNLALTVADLDKSARFIGTILGLQVKTDPSPRTDVNRMEALGLKGVQFRQATFAWPDKTPPFHLIEFQGVDRKQITPLVADPNSTIVRINVKNMESVLAKVKAFPDAKIMNVSAGPVLQGELEFVIVRAPGGAYLQIYGPARGRAQ